MADDHDRPVEPRRVRARRWLATHRRARWGLGAGAVVAVLIALGAAWYLTTFETTDDAQVDGHIAAVTSRINGVVTRVYVEENQLVRKGQLLAELDPRDFQVNLARAEAQLAQAQAQLASEQPGVPILATTTETQLVTTGEDVANASQQLSVAERDYDAQVAHLREAEANAERAEADRVRYQYLLNERAVPRERFDEIRARARAAHASVEAQRALVRGAAHSVDQAKNRVQQARSRRSEVARNAPRELTARKAQVIARTAALKAAQAELERARLDLEYTRIVAPFDGIIGRRGVQPGERVQAGQELLALVDVDHLWVTANFKETQLRHMHPGQKARVKVDAYGTRLDGEVESLGGASGARFSLLPPENATGNYVKVVQRVPVRIALHAPVEDLERLRPGLSVEPRVRVR